MERRKEQALSRAGEWSMGAAAAAAARRDRRRHVGATALAPHPLPRRMTTTTGPPSRAHCPMPILAQAVVVAPRHVRCRSARGRRAAHRSRRGRGPSTLHTPDLGRSRRQIHRDHPPDESDDRRAARCGPTCRTCAHGGGLGTRGRRPEVQRVPGAPALPRPAAADPTAHVAWPCRMCARGDGPCTRGNRPQALEVQRKPPGALS